jgi:tRNA-binding protein
MTATWDELEHVALRVGTVVRAEAFPEARKPAYKLWIDLGELGVRASSAQLTALYRAEELVGTQVLCATGFPPKRIGPFTSEVLVTGVYRDDGAVVLVRPDHAVQNGAKLG